MGTYDKSEGYIIPLRLPALALWPDEGVVVLCCIPLTLKPEVRLTGSSHSRRFFFILRFILIMFFRKIIDLAALFNLFSTGPILDEKLFCIVTLCQNE